MARIRTIKPEFWTDSIVVQLPFEARLLFIGLWNFSDDQGRFADEPDRIKMQVFPGDPTLSISALLDLLEAANCIQMCDSETGPYWMIRSFAEHQKIDHPSKSKFAEPSRKRAIPNRVRRELARKYGIAPGTTGPVECFYCGEPGQATWAKKYDGTPSSWVNFTLEIDHAHPELLEGKANIENLVLACRHCNRSKGFLEFGEFVERIVESSRALAPEWKGMERKGVNQKTKTVKKAKPPENWKPSERTASAMILEFGLPQGGIERYAAAFLDQCAAKGYEYEDFDAAFRNCVRQDWPKFRANGAMKPRQKTAAELLDESAQGQSGQPSENQHREAACQPVPHPETRTRVPP